MGMKHKASGHSDKDYSHFDHPSLLSVLFHPRRDFSTEDPGDRCQDLQFRMPDGILIGARLHKSAKHDPVILFFHGNGEIVSDYDDLGPIFAQLGINFLPCDYRGYGRSTGQPTVTAMMNDCHEIFDQSIVWLRENGYTGKIIVMGRSLGSASALEIASSHPEETNGVIIESGFAYIMPLLELLGLYEDMHGVNESSGPENYEKVKKITVPTLVIHAEYDHIIPFDDGLTLHANSGAENKTLLEIKGADHNSIFAVGLNDYLNAVKSLADKLR